MPDRSQGVQQNWPNYSYVTRVTWQATQRDKFRIYIDKQMNGQRYEGLAGGVDHARGLAPALDAPGWTPQVKWTQATTNRLMLEAGLTLYDLNFRREPQPGRRTARSAALRDLERRELGRLSAARWTAGRRTTRRWRRRRTSPARMRSRSGMNYGWGNRTRIWPTPNPANISQLRFTNTLPAQVVVRNTPIDESIEKMNADFGVFAQDAWTMSRLTLNVGGRFDYFNAEVPALSAPAEHLGAGARAAGIQGRPELEGLGDPSGRGL